VIYIFLGPDIGRVGERELVASFLALVKWYTLVLSVRRLTKGEAIDSFTIGYLADTSSRIQGKF